MDTLDAIVTLSKEWGPWVALVVVILYTQRNKLGGLLDWIPAMAKTRLDREQQTWQNHRDREKAEALEVFQMLKFYRDEYQAAQSHVQSMYYQNVELTKSYERIWALVSEAMRSMGDLLREQSKELHAQRGVLEAMARRIDTLTENLREGQ